MAFLALIGSSVGGVVSGSGAGDRRPAQSAAVVAPARTAGVPSRTHRSPPPRKRDTPRARAPRKRPTPPTTSTTVPRVAVARAAQAGCPVPPQPPQPPPPPPWHPAVLVPAAARPPVVRPRPWKSDLSAVTGKGMWIWDWPATAGGNARAVVRQAVRAGLHSLWIRVGDSGEGFYGAAELHALVPAAHAAGLKVIAWGFPYLYDPVGDARWTAQVLAWRGPGGQRVDGFSADIERYTEGVDLTAQRVGVYLEIVRRAADTRPIVATVYPPRDPYWYGDYPYRMIARYVDAFAPMIYWECTDPGADATLDIARLLPLRPVNLIGQAFSLAAYHGRVPAPSGAELTEFMAVGRKDGALGASFWVWQDATAGEWAALGAYRWPPH